MTLLDRRAMIAASGAALLLPSSALRARTGGGAFSWKTLTGMAQRLARARYVETLSHPGAVNVNYDALHQARFRDERTLWGDLPGDTGVRFFPLSKYATQPVSINIIEQGQARPFVYDQTMFDAPASNAVHQLGDDAGYSGFRVMNAARDADWISFVGASYFRTAGAQRQYGLSARAIAINTSIGKEEFPRFTTFWLERTGDHGITVYALLDGASITGAFRFENSLTPNGVTQQVTAALFPRREIAELGLMPMTSMFWYDQAHRAKATDWRPEIHDSDILAIHTASGDHYARSLINPERNHTSVFVERNPKGFGLIQRDRNFDHYQDDGVFYERRPSLWAAPDKPLGDGQIRLFEFPTDSEYTDNVACYWVPSSPVRPGRRIDASYRLDWSSDEPPVPTGLALVGDIWRGTTDDPAVIRLVIDFTGVQDGVTPDLWSDQADGKVVKQAGYPVLTQKGVYRMVLEVKPDSAKPMDIRAQLRSGDRPISEMLHYVLGA